MLQYRTRRGVSPELGMDHIRNDHAIAGRQGQPSAPLQVEQGVLGVPRLDPFVVPACWANDIVSIEAIGGEQANPVALPLLVDVMLAALPGNCGAEENDVGRIAQALYDTMARSLADMLRAFEREGQIATFRPRFFILKIDRSELDLIIDQHVTPDVRPVVANQPCGAELVGGRKPCTDAATDIQHRGGREEVKDDWQHDLGRRERAGTLSVVKAR